jgi:hypothetical protein
MALNLTLIFDRFSQRGGPILSTNKLAFDYVQASLADELHPFSVPLSEPVHWLEDGSDSSPRKTDMYGDPLHFVSATHLVPKLAVIAKTPWEKAVVAFVGALPPDARVILWWH